MNLLAKLTSLCVFLQVIDIINSVELTFELPDNSKECFYELIEKNKTATLEYQVRIRKSLNIGKMLTKQLFLAGDNWRTIRRRCGAYVAEKRNSL